jgi:hypothetical protein
MGSAIQLLGSFAVNRPVRFQHPNISKVARPPHRTIVSKKV